jgi:O-antigen/teichoic acid export membrane protein
MEAVFALAPSLDRVVLVGLLSAHDMGLYAVARSIAQPLMMLPNAAAMVLFPKAVQRETVEIVTLTGHVSRVTIALTSVIALFYALSGTVLLPILYGAQFEESLSVFRIFVMETVIAGWIWVLLQAFMAAGRPGVVSAAQICGLVMSGILVFFLARIAGLEGAAWALLAASLCRLALLYGAFKPVLGTPAPWPLLTVNDLRGVGVRLFGTPKPAR